MRMAETINKSAENFASVLEALNRDGPVVPKWVEGLRQPAFDKVQHAGLPTLRDEEWRYTNVKPIAEGKYELVTDTAEIDAAKLSPYLSDSDINLVFIDGVLSTSLSQLQKLPTGVHIASLHQAFSQDPERIQKLVELSGFSHNTFSDLNKAFLAFGSYIQIDDNVAMQPTLHLLFVATERQQPQAIFPRSLIEIGKCSRAQVVETHFGFGEHAYFNNTATNIWLQPNSQIQHCKLQVESLAGMHMSHTTLVLERDARAESFNFNCGAKLARNNIDVLLRGEGSELLIDGLYLTRAGQHVDNHTTVLHQVGNTQSSQTYKGILSGKSRAVFNGKIVVKKDAQLTNAFQLNRNLLLDDQSEVNTKPELQIDANDVKCSHGAAIGPINPDEMFYLESRGIPARQAAVLLCRGYANDVVEAISNPVARAKLRPWMDRYFQDVIAGGS